MLVDNIEKLVSTASHRCFYQDAVDPKSQPCADPVRLTEVPWCLQTTGSPLEGKFYKCAEYCFCFFFPWLTHSALLDILTYCHINHQKSDLWAWLQMCIYKSRDAVAYGPPAGEKQEWYFVELESLSKFKKNPKHLHRQKVRDKTSVSLNGSTLKG